jgi:hypothetical protein
MMGPVESSPDHLPPAPAVTWRRAVTVLLLVLGLILLGAAALLLWNQRLPAAEPLLFAVEGKVLVDGEPAVNLHVAFHPLKGGKNHFCPVGRTNREGIFHLTTRRAADGAPAGEYRVTLIWPHGEMDECECVDMSQHDRLQGSYANADQSTFQVRVGSSRNSFWFNARKPLPAGARR